ncbi:MAG: 6-bladed beta-propeller, partial [Candidatus Aminicenantes bacterium]|nr:6-bladed beta-propeller [Candidatus Aminicenantes bacterium]
MTPAVFLVLVLNAPLMPQVIENPAKPLSPDAGRVVTVREEMRIEDTGKDFTFSSVWDIEIAPDGTIFVQDGNQQVLQFDSNGILLRILLKKGQGPGELSSVDSILLTERRILLQGIPPKILAFDFHGKLLGETNLASAGGRIRLLVGAGPTDFYLSRRGLFDPGQGTGWIDFPMEIVEFSPKNNSVNVVGVFPIKSYIKVASSGRGGVAGGITFHNLIIFHFG